MGAFLYGNEMAVFFCKKVDLSPQHETKLMLDLFFILHFTYLGRVYGPPLPTGLFTECQSFQMYLT